MANRTYEYNPTGGSPVINVTAGAELKTAVAVLLTKDGAKLLKPERKQQELCFLEMKQHPKAMILLFRSEIRACGPLVQRLILEISLLLMKRIMPEGNNRAVHLSYGTDTSDSKRRHRKRCDHPCWI